ncbi:hypothetical protein RJ639_000118 [Escallonia herrerae]|uniref:Peroxin-1 n=1 Tax=Escallonia herrerae TaxID=1293975 RepID=A0AA88XBM6_9ASTE|nr:hypothetical protein RJ639_000118 [Escallonia herrerae]
MEFEVRVVAGMESCFVSLPLLLIQTLESTRSAPLPPFLALELRPRGSDRLWHVAWTGSASASPAIEIAQQFAKCIQLSDHTTVHIRAISNLPKATLVTIEPDTEDDWEVLELNSELAEAAFLKQIGIVHGSMRFPLWLHGQTVITFLVVSTFPENSIVQLVPGTEVAVAPKRPKQKFESFKDSSNRSAEKEHHNVKALLRTQDLHSRFVHKSEVNGIEMGVVLTSAVFVHPETAKNYSFTSLQCVIIEPKLAPKNNHGIESPKIRSNTTTKEVSSGILEGQDTRHALVHLLISESVAKGHVMLSQSLRIYVKSCHISLKKDVPVFSLSPCQFKMFRKTEALENNGLEPLESQKSRKNKNMLLKTDSDGHMALTDWSTHERFVTAVSDQSYGNENEEAGMKTNNGKGVSNLVCTWYLGQLNAIRTAGVDVNSLVLGTKTLIHFKMKGYNCGKHEKLQASLELRNRGGEPSTDILYILSTPEEPLHGEKADAYELPIDGNLKNANPRSLNLLLEKLQMGEGVSFRTVKERISAKISNTSISSLSWMGSAAYDVIDRLKVLLSPDSGMLFTNYNLPFPGHVLIYGPPVSFYQHLPLLVFVCCSKLALEKSTTIRQALSGHISEALDHAPSVVIFDDLDSIVASSSDPEGSQPSSSLMALTEFFTDIMDEYEEKRRSSCGIGPIACVASAQSLTNLPQTLSSSGRFDFHVQLPAPAAAERGALLRHEIQKRRLHCSDDILLDVASKCDGYDAYDLEIMVDRSVLAAIGRFVSCNLAFGEQENPSLVRDDFWQAMHEFLPVAMRDVTKAASEGGRSGWEDVGGLVDIRNAITEMIELPSKFPNIFAQAPLRMRSNVLLYGPPGCGKTHIVGAAAAACSLRFISVKGPELLNKYIGASEQAVSI